MLQNHQLSRHKCDVIGGIQQYIKLYSEVIDKKINVPKQLKDETIEKCVKYCCMDIRPMSAIEGNGFKNFGQFLLGVGAKFGKIDINDILPHPTTVTRHINKTTNEFRNNIFKNLFFIINKKYCASTCDMWTDNYRKNSYMSITLHYIDDNWKLNNRLFNTGQFPIMNVKLAKTSDGFY